MEIVTQVLIPALAIIVTGLASCGFALFKAWITSKIENDKVKMQIQNAVDLIDSSVKEVTQTYVDELKKTGKFDAAAQSEAFNKAYANVKNQLTTETIKAIGTVTCDIDTWIKTQIESTVAGQKPEVK